MQATTPLTVHRIEVRTRPDHVDPHACAVLEQVRQHLPVSGVGVSRVYLIEADLSDTQLQRIAQDLLTDAVTQTCHVGSLSHDAATAIYEVHYQPGVMDPVAASTRDAIAEMLGGAAERSIEVRTGTRYDFQGIDPAAHHTSLLQFVSTQLANPVIQDIHPQPLHPQQFQRGSTYEFKLRHISLRNLDDAALLKMSRDAHLFLSLEEMQAIRDYFRKLDREPTDIELETLAQTWSEHCVHKTLKSRIRYRERIASSTTEVASAASHVSLNTAACVQTRTGHTLHTDGSVTIDNLLKHTVAAATFKLMQEDEGLRTWCVSVFKDNSGIVRFDADDGVCIKVETHNHPSAIEPYGGAATGIGGCIRDVMGTGLAARPIANTNVFCVAPPDTHTLPRGVIHPRRTLQQVVAGVRDYGNRMGIPTVNGAVWFHPDYIANPLVFAGCVGLIPLDKCFGRTMPGDHIIALGGRTGRDGIHGATFSSAELTDTHADEFAHAVQIGNAITQKRVLDVILQARDQEDGPLFNAITDCGAGGFSSAVGEMGKEVGAVVQLDRAPLKYQGLSYTEIWISEAQERMVLAVPPEKLTRLKALCEAENVEWCDLGHFGSSPAAHAQTLLEPQLILHYRGHTVGELAMHFLHEGIPTPVREATWQATTPTTIHPAPSVHVTASLPSAASPDSPEVWMHTLLGLLAHPNLASKHWIIRQYDHEVQGGSVIKPLVGLQQDGPSDAAVLRPKLHSSRGIALGCGLQTGLGEKTPGGDSYQMTLAAMDEAVRNVVCVGADPSRIAVLDNFCWPRCDDPAQLGSLVRAAQACYDGALAYRVPFVSGKDSLSNQFTTEQGKLITIAPTMLITALGIVEDVSRCLTMDAKSSGDLLLLVGSTSAALGGSHVMQIQPTSAEPCDASIPRVDLNLGPRLAKTVAALIRQGVVRAAHDVSDGGLLPALSEMVFAGGLGAQVDLHAVPTTGQVSLWAKAFAESPSRYVLAIAPQHREQVLSALQQAQVPHAVIGQCLAEPQLHVMNRQAALFTISTAQLKQAWLNPLDW